MTTIIEGATGRSDLSLELDNGLCMQENQGQIESAQEWFPKGKPEGQSVFIASSRLGQSIDLKPMWFDALRTLACRLDPQTHYFVTAKGVTADPFVRRVAELWGFRVFDCVDSSESKSARDQRLMLHADRVFVLCARAGGNIEKGTLARLRNDDAAKSTHLLLEPSLTSRKVQKKLVAAGAIAWWLYEDENESKGIPSNGLEPCLINIDEVKEDEFLFHWTRRRLGKWPDQSEVDFLDDLIFSNSRAEHSPLASLGRLLATERIIASNRLTRDKRPVVCWTEVPPSQFAERRIFRPHLSRWDFEPYGIAVDKNWLADLGTKPVIYGDESHWSQISEEERVFFQLSESHKGSRNPVNWRSEKEHRTPGDVALRPIPNQAAFVFVPSLEAAKVIGQISRFPVLILNQ